MLVQNPRKSWQVLLLQGILVVFVLVAFTIAMVFMVLNIFKGIDQTNSTSNITIVVKKKVNIGFPVRLQIPTINIDATIDYTGLTSNGAMDVKSDITHVSWYEFGPRPGEIGSAVIAGHYGWTAKGEAAIFNNLHTLTKGDEISIVDNKGSISTFIVRESQKYNPEAGTSNIFKSDDGKAHLNLITCDGVWENSKNTYSDRLVIFTDKK
jgi:sortase A